MHTYLMGEMAIWENIAQQFNNTILMYTQNKRNCQSVGTAIHMYTRHIANVEHSGANVSKNYIAALNCYVVTLGCIGV